MHALKNGIKPRLLRMTGASFTFNPDLTQISQLNQTPGTQDGWPEEMHLPALFFHF